MSSPDSSSLLQDLAALIAIPSANPPGDETRIAAYIRDTLAPLGFRIRQQDYAPGRCNLEARLENGPGPVFAFNTHMDTVPLGEGWNSDPLVLTRRGANLHGRGACDCKGPLAAMLEACRRLAASRDRWSGTLLGVFTGDEEVASAGARIYNAESPGIDLVVVGEPTGNTVFSAHKGSFRPVVRVAGAAAHSGSPHLGENAIYRAAELTRFIRRFHDETLARRNHPLVGAPSLTVTRISGGSADNVIPDHCEMLLDRRLIPGETEGMAEAEIEALLATARAETGLRAKITGRHETTGGAAETPAQDRIVQEALATCRAAGVADPGPFGFQGACDLVHFLQAGARGVIIGPGDIRVAHRPDEFVPEAELVACAGIYTELALRCLRG